MFLKFPLAEIPELKKNSRGVRGIRLEKEDTLEHVYLRMSTELLTIKEKKLPLTVKSRKEGWKRDESFVL